MKKRPTIITVIAILVFFGIGYCVYHYSPRPPKADIVTMADVHQLDTDADWKGKVARLEIVESTLESYDKDTMRYGFLGKVKVKGSPGEVYGQFNMYEAHNLPNILIGDILYVRVTGLEGSGKAFGPMIKGDILYVEKGRH